MGFNSILGKYFVGRGTFALLKKAEIPAVIVECGFLSNFEEEELLQTPKYQQKLSKAIVKGIEKYYKTERKDSSL